MVGIMFNLWNITRCLFILCLLLLPFAEWRIFYLPINGRIPGIDLTGYRSASAFDLTYFVFMIFLLPFVWKFFKEKTFANRYLLFWIPAIILAPVLFLYLWPQMPYLTPSEANVIDTRYFIIHFSVTVCVTIFLARAGIRTIIKGSYVFYSIMIVCFAILSLLALKEFSYFYFNYPFTVPFTISFPFPNQNVAAPFVTICLLGIIGVATTYGYPFVLIVSIPVAVLAAALTGSRSNMLLLIGTGTIFWVIYCLMAVRQKQEKTRKQYINGTIPITAIVVAGLLVGVNYDWQPVRRAFSIFGSMVKDPESVVIGLPGRPRRLLWRSASSGMVTYREKDTESYKLYAVVVDKGGVRKSSMIKELDMGKRYYVRLKVMETGGRGKQSILEVFSDGERKDLVGSASLISIKSTFENMFLFVSDTGTKRGWITVNVSLDNYKLKGKGGEVRFTFSNDEGLEWYEEWYKEKYGDSGGVLKSNQGSLALVAYEQAVRAYVRKRGVHDLTQGNYILEYEVTVHRTQGERPVTGPARFYIGFYDGKSVHSTKNWNEVENALFIAHERIMTGYESQVLFKRKKLQLSEIGDRTNNRINPLKTVRIEKLWERVLSEEETERLLKEAERYRFGSKVINEGDISIGFAKLESIQKHLTKKGSTHNVYLDWYYYVGRLPFGLFVLFIVLLVAAFAAFLWNERRSVYLWFYLATGLQLVVIAGSMYAHPGIWVKYMWFVFGIAAAVMITEKEG